MDRDTQIGSTSRDAATWTSVKAVFLDALELPASERLAFLDAACASDPQLRSEVEALLASDSAADELYETPAPELLLAPRGHAPRLHPGFRLGAYEIVEFVAAGGMGEVYRARHTVLGRDVALKTVSAHGDGWARRRLLREARHAAQLSHPGICTIHEVGESVHGPYIVMEYVEGRALNDLLRERRLSAAEAVSLGVQIAGALEHAHQHGILHRDLKSSNVMVADDDRTVVLDFGLAKQFDAGGKLQPADPTVTIEGALAGTLSHMAPEILRGGKADVRSDVWSLGVVLYELVSGTLPFNGQTEYETTSAILDEPPRPLNARVPLALRLVIERCLQKDPAARYQSAGQARAVLEAVARNRAWPLLGPLLISTRGRSLGRAATVVLGLLLLLLGGRQIARQLGHPAISSVALLPLENGTGDPKAQYYADGLTDALSKGLAELTRARIVARASVARVASSGAGRSEIARQLRADAIVEGRLRQVGARITLDLKLIDPASGRVIWSEAFAREAGSVLALQADVVRALALALRLAVRPEARGRLSVVRAVDPLAYEHYLKGRYAWNQRTAESLDSAIAYFTRAIDVDPTYAAAYAGLADCYNQLGTVIMGRGSPREWRPRAEAAAIKALQLDPYSAEAHAALGYVRHYQWKWDEAERAFRRAIELNPSYSLARVWYANLLMSVERFEEATREVMAARELDPFSLVVNANVGWVLTNAGRLAQAVEQLERTLALDSSYPQARYRLSLALLASGRTAEAEQQAQWLVSRVGRSPHFMAALAQAKATRGEVEQARALVSELIQRAEREYVPPWSIASVLVALRDYDAAAVWTERLIEEQSNAAVYIASDPAFDEFQQHPRVRALLSRLGLHSDRPT